MLHASINFVIKKWKYIALKKAGNYMLSGYENHISNSFSNYRKDIEYITISIMLKLNRVGTST
jgi:hypothetical protein